MQLVKETYIELHTDFVIQVISLVYAWKHCIIFTLNAEKGVEFR
jgi:hypothetical protein